MAAMLLTFSSALLRAESMPAICGQIIDADTHKPIEGAWVVSEEEATRTNREGRFELHQKGTRIGVRAIGYSREQFAAHPEMHVALTRLHVRGLYLSFWGVGSQLLRTGVLDTVSKAHLNAVVIDIKGDRGFISHPTGNCSRCKPDRDNPRSRCSRCGFAQPSRGPIRSTGPRGITTLLLRWKQRRKDSMRSNSITSAFLTRRDCNFRNSIQKRIDGTQSRVF